MALWIEEGDTQTVLPAGVQKVIAIAASTGGVSALETIIATFPANIPPVLLVQHMPNGFTKMFAARMDSKFTVSVKEAETGDTLIPGRVLIAPAGKHMRLIKHGNNLSIECFEGERVQYVIPSADVLFETVAEYVRDRAIGVVLTGMGADGARGLLAMRNAGAKTIGQDKETSAVYGMPKMAFEMGGVEHVLPLDEISDKILSLCGLR